MKGLTSKISKQSSTRTLSHVIGDVKNPKPDHERHDSPRPNLPAVAEKPADVRGVADDQNGDDDRERSGDDERPPATKATRASITHEADQRLDEKAGERSTEPYHARPRVRNPQLLHVRGQERELQSPAELNPGGH